MSTYTEKQLAQNCQASTSETTIYTVPAATTAIVKQIVLANVTAVDAVYSVSVVVSAGTAGVTNRILEQVTVTARTSSFIDMSLVMATAGFISIKQGTASAVTVTISGIEKT